MTAFYVKSDDRSTHLSSLPFAADMGSPLPDQYLDVASYGTELSLVPAHLNRAGDRRYRRSSSGAALTLEPFGGQQAFGSAGRYSSATPIGSARSHPSVPGYWTRTAPSWC